jgi:hypothetical protein
MAGKGGASMRDRVEQMVTRSHIPAGAARRAGDLMIRNAHKRQAWKRLLARIEEKSYGGSR